MLLSDQDAYCAGQTEPADAIARRAVNKSTSISGILFIANDALPHYVVQYLWRTYHITPCFHNYDLVILWFLFAAIIIASHYSPSAVKLLSIFTNPLDA